jgi:hypothetical protein
VSILGTLAVACEQGATIGDGLIVLALVAGFVLFVRSP